MSPPTLANLAEWLSQLLGEPHTLVRAAPGPVTRLALALEFGDLPDKAVLGADALFLHRSRGVTGRGLRANDKPLGITPPGILGAHDGFDRLLTTGPNERLARRLGWQDIRLVEWERASGLVARAPQANWPDFHAALLAEIGGEDSSFAPTIAGPASVGAGSGPLRAALINALRPDLVQQAADAGVNVYLTGQVRPSALNALQQRGLGLVALGHRRTEIWGLRQLAAELRAAFPSVQTEIYASGSPLIRL